MRTLRKNVTQVMNEKIIPFFNVFRQDLGYLRHKQKW